VKYNSAVDGHSASEAQEIDTVSDQPAFLAQRITTELVWADLVLSGTVMAQVEEIAVWLEGSRLKRRTSPGFSSLFSGPSGTGKTLTAALLGKRTGLDVYRVDLSRVISKNIGETEKNLGRIFDRAERNNWILFFDEADALFGKRTQVADAHDRFANQEVNYLLQRIEQYSGLVIMAANTSQNIDEALARRFQVMIHFPISGKS
jgi:SpoVK/Ycf46/Vps4 family AAA+-type ATPase